MKFGIGFPGVPSNAEDRHGDLSGRREFRISIRGASAPMHESER